MLFSEFDVADPSEHKYFLSRKEKKNLKNILLEGFGSKLNIHLYIYSIIFGSGQVKARFKRNMIYLD